MAEKVLYVKTWYLDMKQPPSERLRIRDDLNIALVKNPGIQFYRFLFKAVGEKWGWVYRVMMSDEELVTIIHDSRVEIYVLYINGSPAGYAELDKRTAGEIELVYFGLLPEFIGRGLGKYFLQWVVEKAWKCSPARLWLHTCEYDHPAALPLYLKAGFNIYDEKILEHRIPEYLFETWQRKRRAGN